MTAVRLHRALAGSLLALALGACSSGPSAPAGTPSGGASADARITIDGFRFRPTDLTVRPGQSITVLNDDSAPHTVTAEDASFDTKAIGPGASATFTVPSRKGSYPYLCSIHQYMRATLTVG
ncbi:cupredoxin domain-containing protein [Kitasatospora sp. NPDC093806]|uniref:cupredoxin domain-containing protein n=1 Tax=Kitasatospora sp. NPDC093806 TaxID=3155075 RepID=UPI00341E592C